ncbi:MAG: hypothetical protein M0P19_15340, partial [Nevskia sp.]|nr:hypothetical protein [Nevskia sp.]
MRAALISCAVLGALTTSATSFAAPQPAAKGSAYPGRIQIAVDLTDTPHRLFRVHETMPVNAGPLSLWYPEWLPGNHAPRGPIDALAGLEISANGQRLEWTRDPVDSYAFKLQVPAGVTTLELDYQFASPVVREQGRVVATPDIVGLQWNAVVLYPSGFDARNIEFAPSITLPTGWQFGGALETAQQAGDSVTFKPVSLETLVDSPLFAGRYFKQLDLAPGAKVPVRLNLVADDPHSLEVKPE